MLLASGHGAVLAPESGVRDAEFLVALDVQAGRRGEGSEARIRMASAVEREWLRPTASAVEHAFDQASGTVRAFARDYYGEIVLTEHPVKPDPGAGGARFWRAHTSTADCRDSDEQLVRRCRFAGLHDRPGRTCRATPHTGADRWTISICGAIFAGTCAAISIARAPEHLVVPSGRSHRLEYEADGTVSASVKLQELFGLARYAGRGTAARAGAAAPAGAERPAGADDSRPSQFLGTHVS